MTTEPVEKEIRTEVLAALRRKSAPFSREKALSEAGFSLGPPLSLAQILEEISRWVSDEEFLRIGKRRLSV